MDGGDEWRRGEGYRCSTTEIIIPVLCHPISLLLVRDESKPSVQLLAWGSIVG
jgi:hypothetical protein